MSPQTQADSCDKVKADCSSALRAADEVIKYQDALIVKYEAHEKDLTGTIAQLQMQVSSDQSKIQSDRKTLVYTIAISLLAGAVTAIYVEHRAQ